MRPLPETAERKISGHHGARTTKGRKSRGKNDGIMARADAIRLRLLPCHRNATAWRAPDMILLEKVYDGTVAVRGGGTAPLPQIPRVRRQVKKHSRQTDP